MRWWLAIAALLAAMPALAAEPAPYWLHEGPRTVYDGTTDDLVTGGLGAAAMLGAPPGYADPLHPTAAELRRAALFQHESSGQGFGRLFGPDVDAATGKILPDGGRIAGEEMLAYADDGKGRQNVAMLLQIPKGLSAKRRCLVAVPVAGSASLYRDVVDFGYWGLRRGCAVVYTDKGHGNGFHFLEQDSVNLLDGRQVPAAEAGREAHFRASLGDAERAAFLQRFPHRVAFKAAHSKQNPERDWGEDVLRAIRFAFFELHKRDAGFTRARTLVIATGSANGGGAVIEAAERDREHLIDGVVAREPQVQNRPDDRVKVVRGHTVRRGSGRTLLDYFTFADLYQPCAVLAVADIPLRERIAFAANRCASLHDRGLLVADTAERQAHEALDRLHTYGWEAETDIGLALDYAMEPDATAAKYASGVGRFDVRDRLCGYSFAAVDAEGRPVATPPAEIAQNFAIAPGGVPAGSIDLINDNDPTGPRRNAISTSRSTGRQDYNFDGAMCVRELVIGETLEAKRVQAGIRAFLASGRLDGKPMVIVHGRDDGRVPAGFSSRPYVGLNSLADGDRSRLRYIEVTNAEHFGTDLPGFDTRMVPLVLYHLRALDLMWAYLTAGAPLPPSQVVHTIPRGGEAGHAPPLQAANVPPILPRPSPQDRITVAGGWVEIPE
jgi:hydroxybutyrate-dimer hydrolase